MKRAIDCQLDSLLFGFGLFDKSKKQKLTFPEKVATLNNLGVISPRVLKKINQKRNYLEHEFAAPVRDDVEDALDVATLFIAYTDKFLTGALRDCQICKDGTEEWFDVTLYYEKNCILVTRRLSGDKENLHEVKKEITSTNDEYFEYLKLFLSFYKLKK